MDEDLIISRVDSMTVAVRGTVSNINVEKRTFDMVLATETPVKTIDYSRWKLIDQVLTMSKSAADLTRIKGSGVGFFDAHPTIVGERAAFRLGRITSAKFEEKKCIASVQMSKRKNDDKLEGIWQDIQDGIITSCSIGAEILEATLQEAQEGTNTRDLMTVTRWALMEGSLATIASDPNSGIMRSETRPDDFKMPENTFAIRSANPPPTIPPPTTRNSDPKNMEKTPAELAAEKLALETRATEAENELAKMKRETEVRTLIAEVNAIATRNHLPAVVSDEKAKEFIEGTKSANEVRKETLRMWAEADPSKGAAGGAKVGDTAHPVSTRMENAILLRSGAITEKDLKPEELAAANGFRGYNLVRSAELMLQEQGVNTREMDSQQIAQAALNVEVRSGGGMVTADFPSILGNAINRSLRKQFEMAQPRWKEFCAAGNATDFRPMNRTSFGDAPRLEKVETGGEIRRGNLKDEKTSYFIEAYGKIIPLDWRALVNDDLGAFNRLPRMIAAEVGQLHTDIVYDMILDNPVMEVDGLAVFHATHGNLAASGTALDAANIALAIKAFRNQKSLGTASTAGRFLNLEPEILLVGPELEDDAWRIVNGIIVATETSKANRWKNRFEVIVEPRIQDKSWYLTCKPMRVDGIEYAFLNGREFWTEMQRDFATSGYAWKVESAFGATFLEYRGWYLNEGL